MAGSNLIKPTTTRWRMSTETGAADPQRQASAGQAGIIVRSADPDPTGDKPGPAGAATARAAAATACATDHANAAPASRAASNRASAAAAGNGTSRSGASRSGAPAAAAAAAAPRRHLHTEVAGVLLIKHVERRQADVRKFLFTENDGGMGNQVLGRQILRRYGGRGCSACHCQ